MMLPETWAWDSISTKPESIIQCKTFRQDYSDWCTMDHMEWSITLISYNLTEHAKAFNYNHDPQQKMHFSPIMQQPYGILF